MIVNVTQPDPYKRVIDAQLDHPEMVATIGAIEPQIKNTLENSGHNPEYCYFARSLHDIWPDTLGAADRTEENTGRNTHDAFGYLQSSRMDPHDLSKHVHDDWLSTFSLD